MCYMWTGETATFFIKVSLERRAQGEGGMYTQGLSVQPAASSLGAGLWVLARAALTLSLGI